MTASLTVAWRSGDLPAIGPVEVCDRDPAKTYYKSHTPWTGVVRDSATLTVRKTQVDCEIERLKKSWIDGAFPATIQANPAAPSQTTSSWGTWCCVTKRVRDCSGWPVVGP